MPGFETGILVKKDFVNTNAPNAQRSVYYIANNANTYIQAFLFAIQALFLCATTVFVSRTPLLGDHLHPETKTDYWMALALAGLGTSLVGELMRLVVCKTIRKFFPHTDLDEASFQINLNQYWNRLNNFCIRSSKRGFCICLRQLTEASFLCLLDQAFAELLPPKATQGSLPQTLQSSFQPALQAAGRVLALQIGIAFIVKAGALWVAPAATSSQNPLKHWSAEILSSPRNFAYWCVKGVINLVQITLYNMAKAPLVNQNSPFFLTGSESLSRDFFIKSAVHLGSQGLAGSIPVMLRLCLEALERRFPKMDISYSALKQTWTTFDWVTGGKTLFELPDIEIYSEDTGLLDPRMGSVGIYSEAVSNCSSSSVANLLNAPDGAMTPRRTATPSLLSIQEAGDEDS